MGNFLVAGCDDDLIFSAALSKLGGTFRWGTWNEDNFTLTGIGNETLQDGGFHLRQQRFCGSTGTDVSEPPAFSSRHRQVNTQ